MSKTHITILGCGSSLGVPRIDNYWEKQIKTTLEIEEQDAHYL